MTNFTHKKKTMTKHITQKKIIDALYKANGILTVAARQLGCSRQAIYYRMNKEKNGKIRAAYEDAREESLDLTEGALFKNIKAGKESSIFYYLNNMGRNRGYGKPTLIAPTDPTGTKEYGADARESILSKLFPELSD